MKVLFTSPALFGADGVYGGGERYALELARAVAGLAGGATLLAAATQRVDRLDGTLRIVAGPPWAWVKGQRFNPLPRGLLKEIVHAEVVHCFQQHILLTSITVAAARASGRPVFVTDLGGGGWDVSAWLDTSGWPSGHLHISDYARRLARRHGPQDGILYGGVVRTFPRREGSRVLFVGRLLPHKGADVLIEAADPDWAVDVVGSALDPRYLADLRQLARGKNVRFVHDADDAALEAAYREAAVVVVPSVSRDRYGGETQVAELLGLVAIEAASRGIPVVASNIASLPEIVVDGATGYLVPPGDRVAIRDRVNCLLANPDLRERLGAAGQRRVEQLFTWDRAARIALEHYARALAS